MLKHIARVVTLWFLVATPAGAQLDPSPAQPSGQVRFSGLSVGIAGSEVFTLSYRYTQIGRHGVTFDGAIASAPQALSYGGMVLGLPLGPALSLPFRGGAVMVKGGAMPIVVLSGQGGGGALTRYYGAGLIVGKPGGRGLRLDWTRHRLLGNWDVDEPEVDIFEVGFVQAIG